MICIALDAMGGDRGPEATIDGAAMLSLEEHDIRVLLVGDVPTISERLSTLRYNPARLSVVAAEGCVSMDEPGAALKDKPNCSILTAARLVRDGEAQALVSAGHTGATILAAATTFERLPGIRRAALASVYPTEQRHGPHRDPFALILDVGATLGASSEDLVGFAVMGAAYSSVISEIESPRVALLSNGTEPNKGTAEIIEAHQRLSGGIVNFCGNVEGLDIPRGTVDVIVCDGFLGNVVLKMLEGISEVFADITKEAAPVEDRFDHAEWWTSSHEAHDRLENLWWRAVARHGPNRDQSPRPERSACDSECAQGGSESGSRRPDRSNSVRPRTPDRGLVQRTD